MTQIIRNPCLPFLEIKQGGDPAYSVREHSHDELSFGFVENGSSLISCSAFKFELSVNHLVLFPARTIHLCTPEDKNLFQFLMIHVDADWFSSEFGFDAQSVTPMAQKLTPGQVEIKDRFISQIDGLNDPFKGESRAIMFIGTLLFDVLGIKEPTPAPLDQDSKIAAIKGFLDQNFHESIQLEELARLYGKSKFAFLRHFKKAYQLPPHAYLLNLRINKSKQLLLKGESVASAAVECGFFDQSHFVKTFRRYVGINPADYKPQRCRNPHGFPKGDPLGDATLE